MFSCTEYIDIRKKWFGETYLQAKSGYKKYKKAYKKKMNYDKVCNPPIPCTGQTVCIADYSEIQNYISVPSYTPTYSFGSITPAPAQVKERYVPGHWTVNQEEGNNPMNYATATVQAATTETQDQRKYLSGRLEEIYWEKMRPLEAQFGLIDDDRPTTPKELKKRIEDGKFIIKGIKDADDEDFDDDDYFYGSWANMIRWRDPARKADAEGWEAARKELQTLRQKTLDIIKIKDPEAGLKAVEDLEAWKPTGAAN